MKYIETLHEGERLSGIYLCKYRQSAMTKNGKSYENVILQDKTGVIDAKIWDPNSQGIEDFDMLDYIDVVGDVTSFQGALQVSIKRVRKAREGEYIEEDYLPVSERNIDEMYEELLTYVHKIENPYLKQLTDSYFVENEAFIKAFKGHSAAKSVCAALFHDVGKMKEISRFPENDYTDDGQLLGHIVMGVELVGASIRRIPNFPKKLASELKHCILAHHGELEYGSPKKPALAEALALNFADNTDAKLETFKEALKSNNDNNDWLGYNRLFESNIRKTSI